MTRRSILEYVVAIRDRYLRGSRKEKTRILDEFVKVAGMHRKSAIRLLNRRGKPKPNRKRGRPRLYSLAAVDALKTTWEASDRLCSKRLRPFMPELVGVLMKKGELTVSVETERQLCEMSASTIDRLLHLWRRHGWRRPLSTTRPGTLLKNSIPIRTFTEWEDSRPGFLEVDLVAHCGENSEGFYLTTLSTVDVATGWSECMAVWGKGQQRVGSAIHKVRQQLPFPMLGLDSDNGGEFINQRLYAYCRREGITFTRSRSYKKNDNCYVEQKNWSVVRRVIGYDRYDSKRALNALTDVYVVLRLYVNFFQPVLKLVGKSRHGARVRKVYDEAATPYQRLLKAGVLSEGRCHQLTEVYDSLNPVALLQQIRESTEYLWTLAQRDDPATALP